MNKSSLFLMFAALTLLLAGCAQDEIDQPAFNPIDVDTTYAELPTYDIMEVTSSLKTFVYDDYLSGSRFGTLLVNRMTNRASSLADEGVATVIVEGKKACELSTAECEQVVNLLCADGNIVVVDPTLGEWNTFMKQLCATYDTMEDELRQPEDVPSEVRSLFNKVRDVQLGAGYAYLLDSVGLADNELFTDAIALRDNETYVVTDLSDYLDVETKSTMMKDSVLIDDPTTNKNNADNSYGDEDLSDYSYGQAADILTEWLNEQPNADAAKASLRARGAQLRANSSSYDVTSLFDAQVVNFVFKVIGASLVYDSPQIPRKEATVKVRYEIWPFHDAKNKTDYYSIHESILVRNSEFNTPLSDKAMLYADVKFLGSVRAFLYGPYMTDVVSEHKLENGNSDLIFFSPQNNIGSSSHSQGHSFSVGGGITPKGPQISGSLSFSDSWSESIPDLSTTVVTQSEQPKWTYHAPIDLEGSYFTTKHTKPKSVQVNDCQLDNCWIWKVDNASYGNTYAMRSTVDVVCKVLRYEAVVAPFAWYMFDHYDQSWINGGVPVYHVALDAPLRAQQEWNISLTSTQLDVTEDMLSAYMKRHYSEFEMPLILGTPSDNDVTVIDAYIANLCRKMNADKTEWKRAGYSGQVTISFKLSGNITPYKEYTLDLRDLQ